MRITLAQFQVTDRPAQNAATIRDVVRAARPGDWVVFPEGALSGYFPERGTFIRDLDAGEIDRHLLEIGDDARRSKCYCLVGTALRRDGVWRNSAVVHTPDGKPAVYDKVGLSRLDKEHFTPGHDTPVFDLGGVRIGVLLCRELILPAPWIALKARGAQIVFHVNNAIKPHDAIWEHILITRAVEQGIFVCSVNNASPPQQLRSCLVDPSGRLVAHAPVQTDAVVSHAIDSSAVIPDLENRPDF